MSLTSKWLAPRARDSMSGPSLKRRLVIALIVLLGLVGAVHACASYFLARWQANELLDSHLQGAAMRLAAGDITITPSSRIPLNPPDGLVGELWEAGIDQPIRATDPDVILNRNAPEGFSYTHANGVDWRVYTAISHRGGFVSQVAQPESYRDEIATRAAIDALIPTPILIAIVCIAIPFLVSAAFKSLARVRKEVEAIDIDHLESVKASDVVSEVRPFVESINLMIDRLRSAIAAEKQFITDAAHELRTPIAVLQIQADNMKRATSPLERHEREDDLLRGIARASTLVAQLLRLARVDAAIDSKMITIEVRDLVVTVIQEVLPLAVSRMIDLGVRTIEEVTVEGNKQELRIALKNIVENAVRYTPPQGSVDISVYRRDGAATLEVRDTGAGVPESTIPFLFDRFYRAAPSASEGSGLGLSIVRAVVAKHGGTILLANRTDGYSGLIATMNLPVVKISLLKPA